MLMRSANSQKFRLRLIMNRVLHNRISQLRNENVGNISNY